MRTTSGCRLAYQQRLSAAQIAIRRRTHPDQTNAALALSREGDRWTAVRHASLAVELGLLNDGFEDEDMQMMKSLAEKPENLPCWPNINTS